MSIATPPQTVNVTAAGTLVTLSAWSQSAGGSLCLAVLGGVDVFAAFGADGSVVATASGASRGYCLFGRTKETLTINGRIGFVYLITAGGSVDVQLTQGQGL